MKKINQTVKLILALVVLGLTFTNCSQEEAVEVTPQEQDTIELARSSEIDEAEVLLSDLIIESYEAHEAEESGRLSQQRSIPDCVSITMLIEQGLRQVTVDFGSDGCIVRGHLLKGQIVFTYVRDPQAQQVMISYELVDFYLDAKNILGSKTLLKQLSNQNSNPQFTHTLDVTVIWPNGAQASRNGVKVREWIEGFGSGLWSDNVFEITGNWNTTFISGNSHTYEVVIPLRREVTCNYFVSGSINVQRTNSGGVFDYGAGDCDNQASFTYNNGTVVDITLN
jgi:hypothetical protein